MSMHTNKELKYALEVLRDVVLGVIHAVRQILFGVVGFVVVLCVSVVVLLLMLWDYIGRERPTRAKRRHKDQTI